MKAIVVLIVCAEVLCRKILAQNADLGPPQFLSYPSKMQKHEREQVHLPCKVQNLGSYDLVWKKGNLILAGTNMPKGNSSRIRMSNGYTLEIGSLTMEDSGEYVCEITTKRPMRQMHVLNVLASPRILYLSEEDPVIVDEGSEISIMCVAKGNPQPEITWQKRGGKEKPRDGATLRLVGVNRHHSGLYLCQAINSVGRPDVAAINIQINHIPDIEVSRSWIHGGEGSRSEISCTVYANPPANVSWFFNGEPISSATHTLRNKDHNYFVSFLRLKNADFGMYTCYAANEMGDSQVDIELSGIPNPPVILSTPEGPYETNYTLAWEVDCYSRLIDYRVEIKEYQYTAMEPEPWAEVTVPADSSTILRHTKSYEFTDLQPATIYQVRIYARNQYGWSKPSEKFVFSTFGTTIVDFATSSLNDQADGATEPMSSSGTGSMTEAAVQRAGASRIVAASLWLTFLVLRL